MIFIQKAALLHKPAAFYYFLLIIVYIAVTDVLIA